MGTPNTKRSVRSFSLSKMSTLQFMDQAKISAEIWQRNLRCEVPQCNDRAVAIAYHGVTMLMCVKHDALFKSDAKIANALAGAFAADATFYAAEITSHAYEDAGRFSIAMERSDSVFAGMERLLDQNARATQAANNRPVITFGVIATPAVRPPISSLPADNVHLGLLLFD